MRDSFPLEDLVHSAIQKHRLLDGVAHLLVAVSGGADSIALLHVLHHLKARLGLNRLTAVHFDHRLRGAKSAEDARFVQEMADRLGLYCLMGGEDVPRLRQKHGGSLEMAARECRHKFFRHAMEACAAATLATGHTANDQAEEVLLRLIRGTGPTGLAGMRPREPWGLIRPLLHVTRQEVLDYLRSRAIPFRQDPSNLEPICLRNVLRREVVPLLEQHSHPAVVRTLCRSAELSREEEAHWTALVEKHWGELCRSRTSSAIHLRLGPLGHLDVALQRRVLRHAIGLLKGNLQGIEACHVDAALRLAFQSASGKSVQLPERFLVSKEGGLLVLSRDMSHGEVFDTSPVVVSGPGTFLLRGRTLHFSLMDRPSFQGLAAFSGSPLRACLDAARISWPIHLRCRQSGDRFQPLGLKGTKKLQDFFVDLKIPRSMRREIILVCDTEKVCWIVGYRLDERVKVTEETSMALVIEAEDRPLADLARDLPDAGSCDHVTPS